jgi:hypothetical protein
VSRPSYRTRQVSDIHDNGASGYWEGDGYTTHSFAPGWKSFREFKRIVDVVGTSKTLRVKPVEHTQAEYTGLPYQSTLVDHFLWFRMDDSSLPNVDIEWLLEQDMFTVPHSQRVQAVGRAFNAFSERFPTKISGAEFLQGIGELAALIPKLERTITQTIAGAFLTKKFGWDNLISDLRSFANLVGSIRERMEFLKRTYGKPTKLYYKEKDLVTYESFNHLRTWSRGYGTRLILEGYQCDFAAGASLHQELSHIDDFIGWLRAIVISLGLNNPLNSIWKTTRLSFVVDWFFNVSGHLTRLASVQPAEKWEVSNASHSVTISARFGVYQVNKDLIETPDQPELYLGVLTVKRYVRYIGLPLDLTVFTPSSCTPDQLVLIAAMMGAK